MIVVTGGAGFIGSVVICRLNQRGETDILVVDELDTTEKWKNLVPLKFADYLDKSEFIERLEADDFGTSISAVIHLGACSATTETDAGFLMKNNYRYSLRIAGWHQANRTARFVYASSAATYGNGEHGYSDDESRLELLRPQNIYGYSKHLFDLALLRRGWLKDSAGLKYFNVFGPNEYHKGPMRSLVNTAYPRLLSEGRIGLFKSYRPEYGHGDQRRDFIYVKDAADMTLFVLDNPRVNGIFNIGTGTARTWNDLAHAMFAATGKEGEIAYIDMPGEIRGAYQYFTEADTAKLCRAGYGEACRPLEDAVHDYIARYLSDGSVMSPESPW